MILPLDLEYPQEFICHQYNGIIKTKLIHRIIMKTFFEI
jgi:hypothetical protein